MTRRDTQPAITALPRSRCAKCGSIGTVQVHNDDLGCTYRCMNAACDYELFVPWSGGEAA